MPELRFATESDLPAIMALVNSAYQVEKFFKTRDRLTLEETRECFRLGRFLLLEENGDLAGSVYVRLNGERGYLGLLAVDPARQARGLGARLIAAAEEFARESGALLMELTVVSVRLELPPFYARFGYTVYGTEPFPEEQLPVTQPCHLVRMGKPLGKARA
jgi:N-acetylglutamate synthase-like GNAT family acetyltransferase